MKKQVIVLLIAIGMLMAGSVVLAQSNPAPSPQDVTLRGGHYQMTSVQRTAITLPANNSSTNSYRLMPLIQTADPASGCCCKTNLPCIRR